jgi:hypothetical protein
VDTEKYNCSIKNIPCKADSRSVCKEIVDKEVMESKVRCHVPKSFSTRREVTFMSFKSGDLVVVQFCTSSSYCSFT